MGFKAQIKRILERRTVLGMERRTKWALTRSFSEGRGPTVVASIGRVGSKLIWEAVSRGQAQFMFGPNRPMARHLVQANAWDLSKAKLLGGLVYKTHDLPYALAPSDRARVIFVYGLPSDVILSLVQCHARMGPAWIAEHFAHLQAKGGYEDMFTRDILRLGEQADAWSVTRNAHVLGMRYETMWNHVDVLSDFVQFPTVLPPRRKRRRPQAAPEVIAQVKSTYAELDRKFAALPDYFFAGVG